MSATKKVRKKKETGSREEKILHEILGILVITLAVLSGVALFVGQEAATLYGIKEMYLRSFGYTAIMVPSLIGLIGMWIIWRRAALMKAALHVTLIGLLTGAWINLALLISINGDYLSEVDYMAGGGAVSSFFVAGLARGISRFGVAMVLIAIALIYAKISLKISYKNLYLKIEPYILFVGRKIGTAVANAYGIAKAKHQAVQAAKLAKIEAEKAKKERELEARAKKLMEEEMARAGQPQSFMDDDSADEQSDSFENDAVASDVKGFAADSEDNKSKKTKVKAKKAPNEIEETSQPEVIRTSEEKDGDRTIMWRLPSADDWLDKRIEATESTMDNAMRDKLEKTLQSFDVPAKIANVVKGAAFTRFELELEPGTKVSRIVTLENDFALSLATDSKSIRIEAPIPGKSMVGIEVPNKERALVPMRSIFLDPEFMRSKKPLSFILGEDIVGKPVFTNLVKMPHMLVAGSTNSGKSVCLNCIITNIIAREFPSEVRFIMIDMKRVELTPYDGIPHLLTPVIKEASEAANALRWVCDEMDKRYKRFSEVGVRDIDGYNKYVEDDEEKMFRLVVVIDELADLMMVSTPIQNVEHYICRITQLARATGIHVILATQRPDTKVITGTIKNNIPSRISFAVASQIDSRTVLDRKGAESLLGRGDMLFMPIDSPRMMRLQGAFVSDDEVKRLVKFWKDQGQVTYGVKFNVPVGNGTGGGSDGFVSEDEALYKQAVEIVVNTGQASISMLQRRLRIGYNRSARLVDLMEERNVVGPYDGVRPREVLVSPAGLDEI
ncbi:MAG: DNA translocase FtsK [bacterium]